MFIFLWLILCLVVGALANSRGQSGVLYFFLSALLSPLIGLIIVLLSKDESKN